jgi:hypothetical protein
MRGRLPSGPEYVEQLQGSPQAKERLKGLLETMAGNCRVLDACDRLDISEPRFDQLRKQALQAALERLEPRSAGRPGQTATLAEVRIRELEAKLAEAEMKIKLVQAREEIALALPTVMRQPNDHQAESEALIDRGKKTRRPPPRPRAPASRKPT